ncbi:MAG: sigma-70 family RNA polymerase sigma factor [Scytonematopsis contorta HA4267-MV1]|nr:sigma-70 family RNA polymerase sigma factor [Scytonematopsis contorta HA4267-MV1]
MEQTDTELVKLAKSGDKAAFSLLVKRYQSMVRRIAIGMVAQEEIAQEITQEAILRAYLSLEQLREPRRFKNWLYSIVLNLCRNYLRSRKTGVVSLDTIADKQSAETICSINAVPDPQQLAEEQELNELIYDAFNKLSPKNRMAAVQFYSEELTMQEIALNLGISIVAVKGRLHKARTQLKEHLKPLLYLIKPAETQELKKMKMDASLLKPGYNTDQKEGFYAEFYPNGKLSHFGYYTNGKAKGWILALAQDSLNAKVESLQGEKKLVINYPEGFGTTVNENRHLQEKLTEEERFGHWLKSYIKKIYDDAEFPLVCSFCGQDQHQVRLLISGPPIIVGNDSVFLNICNDCVTICDEIIKENSSLK